MRFRPTAFNVYLVIGLLCVGGCATTPAKKEQHKHRKEASTLLLHLEVNPDQTGHTWTVPILRDNPIMVTVGKTPFLDGGSVDHAAVIDQPGAGFAIQIQFNQHGTWLLENVTSSNPHHRIAVFSQFSDARWLAAPMITHRISNGLLVFTPDATREEAERIVRGLNNVAAKLKK